MFYNNFPCHVDKRFVLIYPYRKMFKKITYSILFFLHITAMAFAWHRPGHKEGEDKPNVPEIDSGDALLIAVLLFCIGLLYYHWRRSRNMSAKE